MAPIGACSPDDVLDRDGKSELRRRQREVPGHRRQEQPEALAHPHAETEEHCGTDQDQPRLAEITP